MRKQKLSADDSIISWRQSSMLLVSLCWSKSSDFAIIESRRIPSLLPLCNSAKGVTSWSGGDIPGEVRIPLRGLWSVTSFEKEKNEGALRWCVELVQRIWPNSLVAERIWFHWVRRRTALGDEGLLALRRRTALGDEGLLCLCGWTRGRGVDAWGAWNLGWGGGLGRDGGRSRLFLQILNFGTLYSVRLICAAVFIDVVLLG